ncbi:hypothetical protein [Gilvimarinus chinensis]|uniref:hypothetical protein n=1 Tax=Gilvimarinus chinensis TaxID=396005 RepID=UPI000360849B|nr:hypothetical protein [Gilvimarinus chinensis]
MDREKEKTKTELLNELESIQGLLLDDIPLLNEVIEKTEARISLETPSKNNTDYSDADRQGSEEENFELDLSTDVYPQSSMPPKVSETNKKSDIAESQQTLFHPPQNETPDTYNHPSSLPSTSKAMGENPFLPQHIRERLKGNRAAEFALSPNSPVDTQSELIDELINSVMPQLEAQLRLKLSGMTEEQLQQLLKSR